MKTTILACVASITVFALPASAQTKEEVAEGLRIRAEMLTPPTGIRASRDGAGIFRPAAAPNETANVERERVIDAHVIGAVSSGAANRSDGAEPFDLGADLQRQETSLADRLTNPGRGDARGSSNSGNRERRGNDGTNNSAANRRGENVGWVYEGGNNSEQTRRGDNNSSERRGMNNVSAEDGSNNSAETRRGENVEGNPLPKPDSSSLQVEWATFGDTGRTGIDVRVQNSGTGIGG